MIGMVGVVIQNDVIVNTTNIMQVVKPGETYLCRFLNPPAFQRVVPIEEIQNWILFQNQKEAEAWVQSNSQQPTPPPPPTPPQEPETPEPQTNGNGATPAIETLPDDSESPIITPPGAGNDPSDDT